MATATALEAENSELERVETREWLESLDYVADHGGAARVRQLFGALATAGCRARNLPAVFSKHPVRQPHPPRSPAAVSGYLRNRAAHSSAGALERHGDGRPRQP